MRELTQTNTEPGNCWQTAWACVLDVDPEVMPDQVAIEKVAPLGYQDALLAYMREHHEKAFVTAMGRPLLRAIKVEGFHVMEGRTVRTGADGRPTHAVVGRDGQQVWDPHPSRAGLTIVTGWEILVPFPHDEWKASGYGYKPCVCPACVPAGAA